MSNLLTLRRELKKQANSKKAEILQRFFKTGKGEYGEGDMFLGISSSAMRPIAKRFKDLKFKEISKLLKSKIHEERQTALLILVYQFHDAMTCHSAPVMDKIFNFYLRNTKYINNWDLVDLSAPKIMGEYLFLVSEKRASASELRQSESAHPNDAGSINRTKGILYKLARSRNIWERRIAILATYTFIWEKRFEETLKISEMLLGDEHDLIHKAVGSMLREVGKRSQTTLEKFLKKHYEKMPRTMLRYAIERFPEKKRKLYLNGKI